RNCFQMGWSSPSRTRSSWMACSDAAPRSPVIRSSTTSPGMTRMRKKMTTATPSSVGNMSRNRFSRYFHMSPPGPPPGALLREPDGIELVVQVVARRHRPALHPRAVRDDPVPLERVEDVHFLVEQALL